MDRGQRKKEGLHQGGPARQAGISTEVLRDADRIIRERLREREKEKGAIPPLYAFLLGVLTASGAISCAGAVFYLFIK